MSHGWRPDGDLQDMRKFIAVVIVVFTLVLVACASRATRTFSVEVSTYSMEYTPTQVQNYLRDHGFQRVKFRDFNMDYSVYEKRNAAGNEQHFRFKAYPRIGVIVRFEKIRSTFGKSGPRLVVVFNEDDRNSMSEVAQRESDRLLESVVARVGADRVKVW